MNARPEFREISPSWQPGRLWSLWDMFNLLFGRFYNDFRDIEDVLKHINSVTRNDNTAITDGEKKKVRLALISLNDSCGDLGLRESSKHIKRILAQVDKAATYNYLKIQLKDLLAAIKDEGDRDQVYHIPRDRGLLVNQDPDPWKPVYKAFRSTHEDIDAANKCYMFDLGTASVFHSMRVLEAGLKALAESLNVEMGIEVWHVVIDQIEAKIREVERNWPRGKTKNDFLAFYGQTAKEFRYFKDGWRNYVSHNHVRYDADQALSTLNHVRDFMVQLSGRLSEV